MGAIGILVIKGTTALSLLQGQFWWPNVMKQMLMMLHGCGHCGIYKGKDKLLEMVPIMAMEPLDLVHKDFVRWKLRYHLRGSW